jgi:hypothetical protein
MEINVMRKLFALVIVFGALFAFSGTAQAQTRVDIRVGVNLGGYSNWHHTGGYRGGYNNGGYRGGYNTPCFNPNAYCGPVYRQVPQRGGYYQQPRAYYPPQPRPWYGPVNGPDYYSRYGYRPGYGYGNGVQPYSYSDPYGYTYRGPVVVPPGNHGYDVGPRVPRGYGNQIYPTPYTGR